jgi:hypothetical protein
MVNYNPSISHGTYQKRIAEGTIMATYSVYNNILIKLENVFLRVEGEVDQEISSLLAEQENLNLQLVDLKGKVEILSSLKRSFELYCDNEKELQNLNRSLFKALSDKQLKLRFVQEKEILLNGYLVPMPDAKLPTVISLNRELKIRKKLQEIELLASFLAEDPRFSAFSEEVERANEIFDLSIESGATDKLESVIDLFQHFFDKVINIYEIEKVFIEDFKEFRAHILVQANQVPSFQPKECETFNCLQKVQRRLCEERLVLEKEVDHLLYQYGMIQNGKKIIIAETKNANNELESILFKEYAIKQKIQELKQYKVDLNSQKDSFMKDPTLDGYTEAVHQLELVENRFRRLMLHRNFEKSTLGSRFFATNKDKIVRPSKGQECPSYNKILFQVLHNRHISSQDKIVILRLSKPSKLINAHSGKFFYQRTGKTRSLQKLQNSFKKLQAQDLH